MILLVTAPYFSIKIKEARYDDERYSFERVK